MAWRALTFKDNVTDFKEAQRRFNSLASHILRRHFIAYVATVEPQKRGTVHYHLVVVCREDVLTGFDFAAFRACQAEFKLNKHSKHFHSLKHQYASSASEHLKYLWRELRSAMPRYGFGRSELLPIRTNADGIANYVGKYLEKGSLYRGEQFKGARMVRYSKGWRRVSQNFSWYEAGAKWRRTVAGVALHLGVSTMDQMHKKVGSQWAYKILSLVMAYKDITPGEIALAIVPP